MKNGPFAVLLLFIIVGIVPVSFGQSKYMIPLPGANLSMSLPVLRVAGDGLLYAAYRSHNRLRRSEILHVLSYDLKSHAQSHHVTIRVPAVRGERVADGLYLSADGKTLFYAELHSPYIVLAISARDLTEIKRTQTIPFSDKDRKRKFAGLGKDGLLAFAADAAIAAPGQRPGVRLLRLEPSDLTVVSNQTIPELIERGIEDLLWNPVSGKIWVQESFSKWREYSESGQATGNEVDNKRYVTKGAIQIDRDVLLVFYGNWERGLALKYQDHKVGELALDCSPAPYGVSESGRYAGALCTKQPDKKWEDGGDKILSSEFLLLRTEIPDVVWRQKMELLDVAEGWGLGYQRGVPAIFNAGSKLWVIVPSKPAHLIAHEIAQNN